MPQSKEVHKEYMRKLRGSQKGSQTEGSQVDGSQLHPVMKYLIDPVLRPKMEAIVQSLKGHNQLKRVYLGYPNLGGIPLDIVGEMLEVTSAIK